jgi:purine-cytosine permease-like protein
MSHPHPEPVNEYEREPVPPQALLGLKSFVGQYAGEHVAGTELMIGPLFLAHGASAFDLIFGLLVGNLLAVLSWTFLTAPIATRVRLTLYFQLEKICGRRLVTLYNLANGVMFTLLAGAMITVSVTALGVWFKFPMPGLTDFWPNSVSWVAAVLITGMFFSVVAAYGYKWVSHFANIAVPWMALVFVAFGIIGLRELGLTSPANFWPVAQTVIWKGGAPLAGLVKFNVWHVMFFAWFCNMAWHIGMADLSLFRYARKSSYGLASAAGMFTGHYLAWICASILFALQLAQDPANTKVLPGPLAYRACGIAGLLCVVLAGWTTANPTLYRAGLAFQAIAPRSSRFRVTLLTGAVATITAVFPVVIMRLLDFVALWGMVLMPMGTVIFVDFWLLPRLGLRRNYAEAAGVNFNWAAGLTWFLTMGVCTWLVLARGVQIYFVSLPGWFIAALLYLVLCKLWQKPTLPGEAQLSTLPRPCSMGGAQLSTSPQ